MLSIHNLIDDARCYEAVRNLRWSDRISCPHCASKEVIKRGFDDFAVMAAHVQARIFHGEIVGARRAIWGAFFNAGVAVSDAEADSDARLIAQL